MTGPAGFVSATEHSVAYEYLSPTSFEDMRSCRLRAAFRRTGHLKQSHHASAAQRLGNVCHRVMENLVRSRRLLHDAWEDEFTVSWIAESQREAENAEASSSSLPLEPERWPEYQVKRARLRRVAERVRGILQDLPSSATVLPEVTLEGFDGRLRGVADLLIRPPGAHLVIDYKTGGILGESRLPREKFVRQLHIYSALEAAASGTWPERLVLFPLRGAPVEVMVDAEAAGSLVGEALTLLSGYNTRCPERQPASPSEENCSFCPYSAQCPEFWASVASWSDELTALRGIVTRISESQLSGTSIEVAPGAGSATESLTLLRNIDPSEHPAIADAVVGSSVAATGLVEERDRGSFRIPPWGQLFVGSA